MARKQDLGMAIALLVVCLQFASPVLAQQEEEGRGRRREEGERRQWDPGEFLNRIDRNSDGVLDIDEMSGRNSRFIEKLGFDASRPIRIDSVLQKIAADRKKAEDSERLEAYEDDPNYRGFTTEGIDLSMAPGFDPENSERPMAPGFGDPEGSSPVSAEGEGQFDENIQRTVSAIMERYDSNGDGILTDMTEDERRRIGRWVGSVEEADLDRDGKLTSSEIGEAIKKQNLRRTAREQANRASRDDDRQSRGERGRPAENTQPSTSQPASPATGRALDQRVLTYVDGVFQKYDANRNGILDKQELESVKVKFTDVDRDGGISRDEAIAHVAGAQRSGESASPAMASARGRRSPGNNRNPRDKASDELEENDDSTRRDIIPAGRTQIFPSEREASPNSQGDTRPSGRFAKLDKNQDGQLQMHEFADGQTWTEELSGKYHGMDANRNGLIEPEEFANEN